MRRLLILLALSYPAFAYAPYSGFCENGGATVMTQGIPSATTVQQSFPNRSQSGTGPSVTVYATGTTNKLTLYSDNAGTPLNNPFPCPASGQYLFFAAGNVADILFSGTGISSFTRGAQAIIDPLAPAGATVDCTPGGYCFSSLAAALTAAGSGTLYITKNWTTTGLTISSATNVQCQGSGFSSPVITVSNNAPHFTITAAGTQIHNCILVGNEAANPTWAKAVISVNSVPNVTLDHVTIYDQANRAGSGNYGIWAVCSHDLTLNYVNVQASGTVLGSDGAVSIEAVGCTGGASSDNTKIMNSFIMVPYSAACDGLLCGDGLRVDADTCNGMTNDNGMLIGTTIIDGGSRFGAEFFGTCGSRNPMFIPLKGWTFAADNFQIIGIRDGSMLSLTTIASFAMTGISFDNHGFYSAFGTVEEAGWQNVVASNFTAVNCAAPINDFTPASIIVDTSGGHNTLTGLNMPCGDYNLNIFDDPNEAGESDNIIIGSTFAAISGTGVANGSVINIVGDTCCTITRMLFAHNSLLCEIPFSGVTNLGVTIGLHNTAGPGGLINHITFDGNTAKDCSAAYNNSGYMDPATAITNIVSRGNDWGSAAQFVFPNAGMSAWIELNDPNFSRRFNDFFNIPMLGSGQAANTDMVGAFTLNGSGTFTQNWPSGTNYSVQVPICTASTFSGAGNYYTVFSAPTSLTITAANGATAAASVVTYHCFTRLNP